MAVKKVAPKIKNAPIKTAKSVKRKHRISLRHIHDHLLNQDLELAQISSQLSIIIKNQKNMAKDLQAALDKAAELGTKVDSLQATVDQEQADIAALVANNAQVVADLQAANAALQAIIDAGGTATDLQPVIDSLDATIAKVDAASADVSSTV